LDETLLKVGSELIWLWIAIEPENRQILALSISKERNMFVAERFLDGLIKVHGKHPVSTDGRTWYPQACRFLNLDHHIHSSLEKSLTERISIIRKGFKIGVNLVKYDKPVNDFDTQYTENMEANTKAVLERSMRLIDRIRSKKR
jgi:transposase-like protein